MSEHCHHNPFQYMLLLRGATQVYFRRPNHSQFQYMLLLRGATCRVPGALLQGEVSIHAPLARSNSGSRETEDIGGKFQYMLLLRGATSTSVPV